MRQTLQHCVGDALAAGAEEGESFGHRRAADRQLRDSRIGSMENGPMIPAEDRLSKIFFRHALTEVGRVTASNSRFIHYTTAESAVAILRGNEVWMRNSLTFNDFMEIEHGNECLVEAYSGEGGKLFKKVLDGIFPGFCDKLEEQVNGWLPHFKNDTYLTCVSEHLPEEDYYGRLSMWRAYGGTTGIGLVFHNTPFVATSNALNATTSPVAYFSKQQFAEEFLKTAKAMEADADFLQRQPQELIMNFIFHMMRFAILCTKHPGFHEEREWRIVHSPLFEPSERLLSKVEVIRGMPQRVIKIPLKNYPDEGFTGAEVPELIERILIGPTQYADAMLDAFRQVLKDLGVSDVDKKVIVSDIPLRN